MTPARRLIVYLVRHRRAFLLGFACILASTSFMLAAPWVLQHALDDLGAGVTGDKVRGYAVSVLALAAAGGWFRYQTRRIVIGASREFEYELRNDVLASLLRLDLAYYEHHRTGDLMSRATNDLGAVRMMMGPALMYAAGTGLTFLAGVTLMIRIDAWLTAVALVPLPFVSLFVKYFGRKVHDRFEEIQAQFSNVSAMSQEVLSGVRVVRAYRQEAVEIERFRLANEEYVTRNRALITLQALYSPSMGLLMGIGGLLVLWLGSREVVAGRLTVGELVAFNAYLVMMAWPMIAFGWVTNLLQRGLASWKRLLDVLDAVPGVADPAPGDAVEVTAVRGDVEFRNLTLRFGDREVLRDISATIPAGTVTAIVGGTGSGKSTLLACLARLHDPPHGTVFVDGVDVRRLPLAVLRGALGFVPQEPFLFKATIGENITFGLRQDADDRDVAARIAEVAAIARLDVDVAGFPHGYDTVVEERGITLSGGQKQRTAIARALIMEPRILVLDDALSAVDTHTEEEILGRLSGVMRERTSILVSHRVSTVRHADQILVLDDGRIAERGTHEELVRRGGVYATLARHQALEEELAAS